MQFYIFNVLNENPYHLGKLTFSKFFKFCSHFNQRLFKFDGISSSQSKEIFHSYCKINFASSIDGVKSPNRSKAEDIKLSKPLCVGVNGLMTALL